MPDMTEFEYSDAAHGFRLQVRSWIADNIPDGLVDVYDWASPPLLAGGDRTALDAAVGTEVYQAWQQRLLSAALICPGWPVEAGGSGWSPMQVAILEEECFRARVPRINRGLGEQLIGPAVIAWGTDDQKARFLPRIIDGTDRYCQGFSEPSNGSDLAGLATAGAIVGDEIVMTGQKVWTSGFFESTMICVLCRTDAQAPKHRGLTFVLVPLEGNAITFRPVRQITGGANFAETFLDGARAPVDHIIGPVNSGWQVANTVLAHERATNFALQFAPFHHEFENCVSELALGSLDDAALDELAGLYTDLLTIRTQRMRFVTMLEGGADPGPEASALKLYWSEYYQRFCDLLIDIGGEEACRRPDGEGYRTTVTQEMFLRGRAATIYAGTSEVQRNVLAERVLGLPREPLAK
jgi:alkylation response protein AidB-like acyl-CoA dehydrogenase